MRYFIGSIGTIVGFLLVWKTDAFTEYIGTVDFAEHYLGGTRNFIKYMGVAIMLISWLYMFQLGGWLLETIFLPKKTVPE